MNQNKLLVKLENAGVQRTSKWIVKGISFEIQNVFENLEAEKKTGGLLPFVQFCFPKQPSITKNV